MTDDNISARVNALEERAVYQDETIEALNLTITKQWDQIDKITRMIEVLTERIRDFESKATQSPPNERPPHY